MAFSIFHKVFGRLSTKIRVPFANIDVSSTSATTVSLKSSKISAHPTATLVQKVSGGMKLHPSIRGSRKVMNFTHSMESSMPKIVSARLVYELTVITRTIKYSAYRDRKTGCCSLASSGTHESSTMIKSPKCH
ncbi:hypothetical protein ACTXT7_009639 [Hymenolepis weldensis]